MFKGWPLGLRSHSGGGVTGVAQSSSTLILVETASYIPHAPLQVPVHDHHHLQTVSMNSARINRTTPPQMPVATKHRPAPPPPSISTSTSQATKSAPRPPKQRKPRPDSSKQRLKQAPPAQASTEAQPPVRPAAQRDSGVSDVVWNQLQADIAAREEAKRKAAAKERLQQGVTIFLGRRRYPSLFPQTIHYLLDLTPYSRRTEHQPSLPTLVTCLITVLVWTPLRPRFSFCFSLPD